MTKLATPSIATHIILLLLCFHSIRSEKIDAQNETGSIDDLKATTINGQGREEDLLKWALRHADPETLHQKAKEANKSPSHDSEDSKDRIKRVTELLQTVNDMPSEAQLLEDALRSLQNSTSSKTSKIKALEAITVLVEPIDNAEHLLKIGGLRSIVTILGTEPGLESHAARVIAVASSNNIPFLLELMKNHPEVILKLVQLLSSSAEETVAAAVYAAGNILRNSQHGRELWSQARGGALLLDLVKRSNKQSTQRTQRRALGLATDLFRIDPGSMIDSQEFVRSLRDIIKMQITKNGNEMDVLILEKAVLAVQAMHDNGKAKGALEEETAMVSALHALVDALKRESGKEGSEKAEYMKDVIALAEDLLLKMKTAYGTHDTNGHDEL